MNRTYRFASLVALASIVLLVGVGLTSATPTTEVSVTPQSQSVAPGETATYYITVDNVQGGVGAFDITVTSSTQGVTITGLEQEIHAPIATVEKSYGFGNYSASLIAALGNTPDSGSVKIARVEVTGQKAGTISNIDVKVNRLGSESGVKYTVTQTNPASTRVTSKTTGVRLTPGIQTAAPGTNVTYDVVVDEASGGVGVYELTASTTKAEIVGIADRTGASLTTKTWGVANQSVTLSAALADTNQTGRVRIASVTVAGERATSLAHVNLSVASLGDESGNLYSVSTTNNATLHIKAQQVPIVTGNNPVQDLNGDSRYEDITGDDRFTIVDVQALFVHLDSDAVQNNVALFDFSKDGVVNIIDVQALFAQR